MLASSWYCCSFQKHLPRKLKTMCTYRNLKKLKEKDLCLLISGKCNFSNFCLHMKQIKLHNQLDQPATRYTPPSSSTRHTRSCLLRARLPKGCWRTSRCARISTVRLVALKMVLDAFYKYQLR